MEKLLKYFLVCLAAVILGNLLMKAIDLVLFTWAGLSLMFIRATILKDMLNIVTIGFGFIIHATIMALILFK
ncbi:MAG: hypothetical protein EBU90_07470 [Proteobacteria bacterium]|nr:hypothetical protein [Pseudomonadota bacterium]NBP13457.1 hypothetical protein [bacterium]